MTDDQKRFCILFPASYCLHLATHIASPIDSSTVGKILVACTVSLRDTYRYSEMCIYHRFSRPPPSREVHGSAATRRLSSHCQIYQNHFQPARYFTKPTTTPAFLTGLLVTKSFIKILQLHYDMG